MTSKETILAFIDRINAHDVDGLAQLMTDDHRFIDAQGNEVVGRETMTAGWRGYFNLFPVYSIEVNEILEQGETFAMFGFAGGALKGEAARVGDCRRRGGRLSKTGTWRVGRSMPTQRFRCR